MAIETGNSGKAPGAAAPFRHRVRTYGAYQVFIDGAAVPNLSGHVCECTGPGDNTEMEKTASANRGGPLCVVNTIGPLYRSVGSPIMRHTRCRDSCCSERKSSLESSYTQTIRNTVLPASDVSIRPSRSRRRRHRIHGMRARVIALIDSLKMHDPAAFAPNKMGHNTTIQNAFMAVDGETMDPVSDDAIV